MGMTYKPNTSDMRESPSMDIIRGLDLSGAVVSVADDHAPHWPARETRLSVHDAAERAGEFDLVLIATDHDDVDYETLHENASMILDTRNRIKTHDGKVHKL